MVVKHGDAVLVSNARNRSEFVRSAGELEKPGLAGKLLPWALTLLLLALQPSAGSEGSDGLNRLSWATASEVDNFGYHVYRGESADGPFRRITETPIPGAGTTDMPSSYEYLDETADPDKAYWYYVESISIQGRRERFTPVRALPPRNAPDR